MEFIIFSIIILIIIRYTYCADDAQTSSSIIVVLDSWDVCPVKVSQRGLQAKLVVSPSVSGALAVVEPRKLPVPDIICQEPPDEEDSFRCRRRPGTGTATGEVRLCGKGDRDPCAIPSLFGEG